MNVIFNDLLSAILTLAYMYREELQLLILRRQKFSSYAGNEQSVCKHDDIKTYSALSKRLPICSLKYSDRFIIFCN